MILDLGFQTGFKFDFLKVLYTDESAVSHSFIQSLIHTRFFFVDTYLGVQTGPRS